MLHPRNRIFVPYTIDVILALPLQIFVLYLQGCAMIRVKSVSFVYIYTSPLYKSDTLMLSTTIINSIYKNIKQRNY